MVHLTARSLLAAAVIAALAAPGLHAPAHAQDTPAPDTATSEQAPADAQADAQATQPAPAEQAASPDSTQPYFREDVGDWRVRCVNPPIEGAAEVCQLFQLLRDQSGNPVAQFTVLPSSGEDADGGAIGTIVTPLETLLTPGLRFAVDDGPEQVIPFTWCAPSGCYVRFRLAAVDVEALKSGNQANIAITPLAAPDQQVELVSSLSGFTAGIAAVLGN